jgi:hypothetical protein
MMKLKSLEGRFYLFDKENRKEAFKIIRNTDTHLIGKKLHFKTPVTCTHPKIKEGIICRGCYSNVILEATKQLHVGLLSAYAASDDVQQVLLSAKHTLNTVTDTVLFSDNFDTYMDLRYDLVYIKPDLIEDIEEGKGSKLSFYFNNETVKKVKDGEGRRKTRIIQEIVIYDHDKEEFYTVEEFSNSKIYLSLELSQAYREAESKSRGEVFIPIEASGLFDFASSPLFEIEFKNKDLTEPIKKLDSIINTKQANEYTYNDLIDTVVPLFNDAGIHMPQIHFEIVVSQMVRTKEGKQVDWTKSQVDYICFGYTTAIKHFDSAILSIINREAPGQLKGDYGFFDKKGTSIYDCIADS